jgi:glycopeptide antibiotics resistance protein
MLIRFSGIDYLIGLALLCLLLFIIWRRNHDRSQLLFLSIFWIYLLVVMSVVIFPIEIDTGHLDPAFSPRVNLMPFDFSSCAPQGACALEIGGNILLTIPFGFGINFLTRIRPRRLVILGIALGVGFELAQLALALLLQSRLRMVDVDDSLFNAVGVCVGYILFRAFAWLYVKIPRDSEINSGWLFADLYRIAREALAANSPEQP